MRLTKLITWVLLCGTFALAANSALAQASARITGRIIVAKATGDVTGILLTDQSQRKLSVNDVITQNYRVLTGVDSQAILVFSNGATINLGSQSDLSIEEFLQDPFDEQVALRDLKEEPATSTTRLNLSRGELVGNVKKLRPEQGSSFVIKTPVGAAGIRGTTFRIVFRPDTNGRVTFTLSTSEGIVLFEAPANAGVSVETGNEVSVDVDVAVDSATGAVTLVAPPVVNAAQEMTAATQASIATAVQEIVEVSQNVILSTTPTAQSTPSGPQSGTSDDPPAFIPPQINPPVITTPIPDVTPGAGAN